MRVAAGGEEASELGSSEAEAVPIGTDCRFSGGGISIGRAIGVGTSESGILSSLPVKMKHEELSHYGNRVGIATKASR